MDEEYDVIVCGTGLKECILSGLLSTSGKKVLHLDRNSHYGAECASLNMSTLWEKFRPGQTPPAELGANREWNVDLVPKFIMAAGDLVKILLKTKVSNYLEWKSCEGSYVYKDSKIFKVPATAQDGVTSAMMGVLEKPRFMSFVNFVTSWDESKPESMQGFDPIASTMSQVYEKFGLEEATIDFVGHAVALMPNDEYLALPCGPTIQCCKLYLNSVLQYGGSPFIYPIYGLGGLPEGFSRLAAIHGGTYMLNKPVDAFEYGADGKVCGVRSGDEVAKTKMVICDPSYADPAKTKVVGKVIRSINILGAPIPDLLNKDGKLANSGQIIIPQKQLGRKNDIYVMMVSWAHCVASKDRYIAIVSTVAETDDPNKEIEPALALLGPIIETFVQITELKAPTGDGTQDQVFVSASYDPTSHFEDASKEVLTLWRTITGSDLDLTDLPEATD